MQEHPCRKGTVKTYGNLRQEKEKDRERKRDTKSSNQLLAADGEVEVTGGVAFVGHTFTALHILCRNIETGSRDGYHVIC